MELIGVGLSVIDDAPEELCFVTLKHVKASYISSNIEQDIDLTIGGIQVSD